MIALDTSLSALLNAAGAFLYVVVGVGILLAARGSRWALAIGSTTVTFGVWLVADNLVSFRDPAWGLVTAGFGLVTVVPTTWLVVQIARPLPRRQRSVLVGSALVAALTCLAYLWLFVAPETRSGAISAAQRAGYLVQDTVINWAAFALALAGVSVLSLAVLAAGLRSRRPDDDGRPSRALRALAAALAVWPVTFGPFFAIAGGSTAQFTLWALAGGLLPFVAITTLLPTQGDRAPRVARGTFLLLAGLAAATIALTPIMVRFNSQLGLFGVARTIGAGFLAAAVLKHDLLGVPLPHFALRRGPLAATALATLFIVAQIAQNFFATKYGLLLGGVVAGAFLFMASPIERLATRLLANDAPPRAGTPDARSPSAPVAREESYRNAVRLALRDRRLTRAEEAHLHRLAEDLGLGASRAHAILVECEAEAGVD